ncbi:MAG: phosphoribosylformylglycinamidine synthase [Candidatus Cloacimonetes bacterium 4572_65]|nr:MAG: phosphoribosylformylglycinamidine synthase [Candidatus Cloacimonetes bacterium 4572_65]
MIIAKVYVTLKPSVLDPQGKQVMNSLQTLGYDSVEEVRVSKVIEIKFNSNDIEKVEEEVHEMCIKILANPNTETYSWNLKHIDGE